MRKQAGRTTRRRFLTGTARGAGVVAVSGGSLGLWAGLARGASAGKSPNPFAYDVEHLARTDPKLIRYEEGARFAVSRAEPRRIAIGPGDRVYVAGADGVSVLDRTGGRVNDIAVAGAARSVAVGKDGTVYVGAQDHVEVFDGKGERLETWESAGKGAWISGLAVGESEVFAADSGNRVVLRYDKSGKLIGRIGERDKGRNVPGLVLPSPYLKVELARDGLLRVNNPGRHRMEAYTAEGDLEFFWGKASGGIEGFCGCCNPVGLAMLPDGRYVTCEKGLPRVKVYLAKGEFESVVAGVESFAENWQKCSLADCTKGGLDAAVDSEQRIYILDLVASNVRVMKRKA